MSKEFAWQLFKNTGNLDAFMIMRGYELGEDIMPDINSMGANNGNNKNQGDCN